MSSLSKNSKKTFINLFSKYYGKSYQQLIGELGLQFEDRTPKNIGNIIIKNILNNAEKEGFLFPEGIIIKTIRVNEKGNPLESMSFAQINYNEIVKEKWEESYLFKTLSSEFLFVIFQLSNNSKINPTLAKAMFWKMSEEDLGLASKFWELTKDNIYRGDYKNFISIKNNFICHVRSKGINSEDLMKTPQGTLEPKKAYWLNSSFIKTQIN
jgi:DNA mismatch repair protein MutH